MQEWKHCLNTKWSEDWILTPNNILCSANPVQKAKVIDWPLNAPLKKEQVISFKLVHSDICGKNGTQSLGSGEYFVTFVDDHTTHVWVYILKHKDEVFSRFQEWKAQV